MQTKNKHTQEPWPECDTDEAMSADDYARAKACVDACVGISNDELKEIAAEGGMLTPRQQIADLVKERDTAWHELRHIRNAIKADPEESTFDEVVKVLSQRDELMMVAKKLRYAKGPQNTEIAMKRLIETFSKIEANCQVSS